MTASQRIALVSSGIFLILKTFISAAFLTLLTLLKKILSLVIAYAIPIKKIKEIIKDIIRHSSKTLEPNPKNSSTKPKSRFSQPNNANNAKTAKMAIFFNLSGIFQDFSHFKQ